MKKALKYSISALLAMILPVLAASAQNRVTVKASLDSATLLMGRQTRLHVEIVAPEGTKGGLMIKPQTMIAEGVEVASLPAADTTDLGNALMEIKQDIIIQAFDSGDYVIPELVFLAGGDSVLSNKLALRVIPADVSQLTGINPDEGTTPGESRWWDFLPAFLIDYWEWILLGLIIIAAGTALYLSMRKKKLVLPFRNPEPKLSPYEVAVRDLNNLKERNLCANGQEKEYYTRLTDILRIYLQERFGINAMEMTSTQITRALNENEETRVPNRLMRQILEIADFVKFAKVRPMPEDNVKAFASAMQFVEDTRPLPPPAVEEGKTDGEEPETDKKNPTKKK